MLIEENRINDEFNILMAIEPKVTEMPTSPRDLFTDVTIERQSFILDNEGNVFVGFDMFDKPIFVAPEELDDFEIEAGVFLSSQDRIDFVTGLTEAQRNGLVQAVFVSTSRDMLSPSFKITDLLRDRLQVLDVVTRENKPLFHRPMIQVRLSRHAAFMEGNPVQAFKEKLRSINTFASKQMVLKMVG